MTRFCVVTPVRDAEDLIGPTILSIQSEAHVAGIELHHTVVDGSSTDQTLNVARRLANERTLVISEPDSGMYDAIAKGFESAPPCDVYCYLNAGDLFLPGALRIVDSVFSRPDETIDWIVGARTILAPNAAIVNTLLPWRYRRRLLQAAWYGTALPFVPQESSFWSRRAHESLNWRELRRYKLAGDAAMWITLAQAGFEPRVVEACLAGFRIHDGQLSSNRSAYRSELLSAAVERRRPTDLPLVLWDLLMWQFLPARYKRRAPWIIGMDDICEIEVAQAEP